MAIIPANAEAIARRGSWVETSHRYAECEHLHTCEQGASLTIDFEGVGLGLRLGQHAVPAYGPPNLGELAVRVDGAPEQVFHPATEPLELGLARDLRPGWHRAQVVHRLSSSGAGVRIEAFSIISEATGELGFFLGGEHNGFLVDARAVLSSEGRVVADRLVRNWLTGACRLVGLPPGEDYRLEVQAIGWRPAIVEGIRIVPGVETVLPPIHLAADPATVARGWLFPRIGRQAVTRAGEGFRARLQARKLDIIEARIERAVGVARFSRKLNLVEDEGAAFYYDREIILTLPEDTRPGLYDLKVRTRDSDSGTEPEFHSPRAVMVVDNYPCNPVFVSWGHLDTHGHHQAGYLRELVAFANLAGADMVLVSNACNPAYVAGGLAGLEVPCVVNFGNHQFHGFEHWFGPQEGIVDYGPELCVLNRSLAWHEGTAQAEALFSRRKLSATRIINSFEYNVPVDFLERHGVALVHDGHGPGAHVMIMGKTPTLRVGKGLRVIHLGGGHVLSCTYMGDATAPIPFPRDSVPPLRFQVDPPANGQYKVVSVKITNELAESFGSCRVSLLMPAGEYVCAGGRIAYAAASDCGRFSLLTVRAGAAAGSETILSVKPV